MASAADLNAVGMVVRQFSGRRSLAHGEPAESLSPESQAALRQLSLERLMAYGVHHADAIELRARVASGEPWKETATELAETCLNPPESIVSPTTGATLINRLYRSSALLRMSQMMMLTDVPERKAIFARAGELFREAALADGGRRDVRIETRNGPLIGWHFAATDAPVGQVLVIGGVEGWAMDFAEMGVALAARNLEVLVLDGPGQGESRLLLGHYLSGDWVDTYRDVLDWMEQQSPHLPIGMVGNSMGGSFAVHLAAVDSRIVACCDNGGTSMPAMAKANATFFLKMTAHVGNVSEDEAVAVWSTVRPTDPEHPIQAPLLVIQGGLDPLITNADATFLFDRAASPDKEMVIFSDGDHCVYNHPDDKLALIGDWLRSRLDR